jgi:hypothetical protein
MTTTPLNAEKPFQLTPEDQREIDNALVIVGDEHFTTYGTQGSIEVRGALANAIMTAYEPSETKRKAQGLIDQPVKISRGSQLDVWCTGMHLQDIDARRLVHCAVNQLQAPSVLELLRAGVIPGNTRKKALAMMAKSTDSTEECVVFNMTLDKG